MAAGGYWSSGSASKTKPKETDSINKKQYAGHVSIMK